MSVQAAVFGNDAAALVKMIISDQAAFVSVEATLHIVLNLLLRQRSVPNLNLVHLAVPVPPTPTEPGQAQYLSSVVDDGRSASGCADNRTVDIDPSHPIATSHGEVLPGVGRQGKVNNG